MPDGETATARGPLKYAVDTPAPQLEAGRKISVSLLITNPYDVAVTIEKAETVVPAHFEDADRPNSFLGQIWASAKSEVEKDSLSTDRLEVVTGKSLSPITDNGDIEEPIVLQPGNTVVRAFTLRTKQSLLFTPSVHSMNAQVSYKIDGGKTNYDSVKYQLNIRAQFKSLIIGSLLGSLIGTLVKFKAPLDTYDLENLTPFFAALATSLLVGSVLVIAFARKKDAQPFITVEDFWGGFFVGFVAGYVGESILTSILRT